MSKYRIRICKQCGKKRRIYRTFKPDYWIYRCSQGHQWEVKILRTEEIVQIMEDVFLAKVKNLFDRDDTFYKSIKR